MKTVFCIAFALFAALVFSSCAGNFSIGASVPQFLREDPAKVNIVYSDIENFWAAYDAGAQASHFEQLYFGKASNGLKDFVRVRSSSVNPTRIAFVVRSKSKYFASIRPNTMKAAQVVEKVRELFYKFKVIFPEAQFSDVYLMMGGMSTGGTFANNSILIGTEMFSRGTDTPTDELSAWEKVVTKPIDDLPVLICHELIHIEQGYLGMNYGNTLLGGVLQEGGADFVSELFVGRHTHEHLHTYGNPRQKELWAEFSQAMNSTTINKWLYNANDASLGNRPADMGYYIGYKICEAYYNKVANKQEALREMMSIKNPALFLQASGYNP